MGAHHTACMDVLHWRESYYNLGYPAPSLIARAQQDAFLVLIPIIAYGDVHRVTLLVSSTC